MYGPQLLYPFIGDGHLGCFYVPPVVNGAATNFGVPVSF